MKTIQAVFVASFAVFFLVACQTIQVPTVGSTPQQIATNVEAAGVAREKLWDALQSDRPVFTETEWQQIDYIQSQAMDLSEEIVIGLTSGVLPPVGDVEIWGISGAHLLEELNFVLGPRKMDLSSSTRSALAIEKARLKRLKLNAQAYITNPNSVTYAQLVQVGMHLAKTALGAAVGIPLL